MAAPAPAASTAAAPAASPAPAAAAAAASASASASTKPKPKLPVFPANALDDTHLKPIAQWTTTATAPVLRRGKWLTVHEHAVTIPAAAGSGKPPTAIPDWTWVESPHFVNVICVRASDRKWLVFAQPKYAVGVLLGTNSFAPIGGYLEPAEDPLHAAQRELHEECGYVAAAADWVPLHSGVADANRGCGLGHLFLAINARPATAADGGAAASDDLEEQHTLWLTTEQLEELLLANGFRCHSWAATVALALLHWRRRQSAAAPTAAPTAAATATADSKAATTATTAAAVATKAAAPLTAEERAALQEGVRKLPAARLAGALDVLRRSGGAASDAAITFEVDALSPEAARQLYAYVTAPAAADK